MYPHSRQFHPLVYKEDLQRLVKVKLKAQLVELSYLHYQKAHKKLS